ncbi:hypothetical protein BV898_11604 [Hypsibius exemplaris]|uniref:Uncharacterized protein n=1 Tax=Hypsibius exemplaris TaxID=2072580 RepID=A0A1W0WGC6_HYPEX|nr:hypothetical protein BV898_11604 [Hypsibius exemplaris]
MNLKTKITMAKVPQKQEGTIEDEPEDEGHHGKGVNIRILLLNNRWNTHCLKTVNYLSRLSINLALTFWDAGKETKGSPIKERLAEWDDRFRSR